MNVSMLACCSIMFWRLLVEALGIDTLCKILILSRCVFFGHTQRVSESLYCAKPISPVSPPLQSSRGTVSRPPIRIPEPVFKFLSAYLPGSLPAIVIAFHLITTQPPTQFEFSWRLLPLRECLAIHIELSVSVEQATYDTGILHIRQILPPETALALVLVTCPDSDHLNESSCCNLLLWGRSVRWSPGGWHWVKSRSISLNNVLVKGFFPCFLKVNAYTTCT
jgi:hypothetical protein